MDRYPLPGYLQHHTQPGGDSNKIRKEKEKSEQDKITQLHTKKKEHKI